MRSITTVFLFLALAAFGLCRPVPDGGCPIAHCSEVMGAIGKLKGEVTDDPSGVTEKWNGKEEKEEEEESNDDGGDKKTKEEEEESNDDGGDNKKTKEEEEESKAQDESDYPAKEADENTESTATDGTDGQEDDQTPDDGGSEDCGSHPGAHGKNHSSGKHSTANCSSPP